MDRITKYVGMDVSKDRIDVAVADSGREHARYWGPIRNSADEVRKMLARIGDPSKTLVCYEAGPTGYVLARYLKSLGFECVVVAPSLTPKQPGNHVKTDRKDAIRLAELLRAGELTPAWVPDEQDEGLRDLVRAREDSKEDLLRAKQRLSKFLLRHGVHSPSGIKPWGERYKTWLHSLHFEVRSAEVVFRQYVQEIERIEETVKRLEDAIHEHSQESVHAPVIQALQVLRGIKEVAAATIVAEVGSFLRFKNARQLMGYSGLVPKEYSSGESVRRGSITKTGNSHLRKILIESSWSYRYNPRVSAAIRKRQDGQNPDLIEISWKAQNRLHKKYSKLLARGKSGQVAVTAVARELLGFVWSVGCRAESQRLNRAA